MSVVFCYVIQGGPWLLLDFENFSNKGYFLSFEWEKRHFTTFSPLGKFWKNFPVPALEKILSTPMFREYIFLALPILHRNNFKLGVIFFIL